MRDLQASLRDHSMAMLRVIAELNGVELTTNVREEAAAQVASALAAAETVATGLARCSVEAQAAWQAVAAAGGRMKTPAFIRRYGALRPIGPGKLEREMIWRDPANPAEELWYRGLLYRGFADLDGGPAEYFYIPRELLPAAAEATQGTAGTVPIPQPARPPGPLPAGRAPRQAQGSQNRLAVDACTLLAAISENPLRVDRGGAWRSSDEAHLRELLLLPDPVRFALLITLARDLGWLAPNPAPAPVTAGRQGVLPAGEGRLTVKGDTLSAWLHAEPWGQRSALFGGWRDSTEWNDLRRLPSLKAEGEWRNDPVPARRAILAALAQLEPGAWYAIADVVAWIKAANPDFQRPDGTYTGWYLRDRATGRYLSGFEAWDEVEGRLIYFMITEPLFWLSAIELGMAADSHAEAFRIAPAGAAWLCGQPPPEPIPPDRLRVEDDFGVVAALYVPLLDRFRLLRFADPVAQSGAAASGAVAAGAAGEASGAPAGETHPAGGLPHYRITRRSLARARAAGLKGDKILQFLLHATGGRVPERVEAGLKRWEEHGGAVHVNKGALLRVEDASVLAALRADPVAGSLLGEIISAQAVLVSTANLPRLLSVLKELGYSVKVDE